MMRIDADDNEQRAHFEPGLLTTLNKTNKSSHHGDLIMKNRV